jgi:predicted acylesterase/phospholipase RssA
MLRAVKFKPCAKPDTLVVSGGGLKGVAALGAVHALRRRGVLAGVKTMVGTSAGALVCAALACGRDPVDIVKLLGPHAFRPDINLSGLGGAYGLDSGQGLTEFADAILGGRYTFGGILRDRGIRLVVCVTSVAERCPVYLTPETHPDMDVAMALRMSCSIPLYFAAVRLGEAMYVDGVLTDNFPCEWAVEQGARCVLGIRLVNHSKDRPRTLEAYIGALVESTLWRHGPRKPARGVRILEIDTGYPTSLNFNASKAEVHRLFACGARQARLWIKKTE